MSLAISRFWAVLLTAVTMAAGFAHLLSLVALGSLTLSLVTRHPRKYALQRVPSSLGIIC